MARTVSGFQGSPYGAAAAALSPSASGIPALVAKPSAARTAMETRRLGSRKISLPVTVTADESPQDRAIAFFAAKSILETEARGVDYDVRLTMLGDIMNQEFVASQTITEFMTMYSDQLEDPSRFTIVSYHDRDGTVLSNSCVGNTMVLKQTGHPTNVTTYANRREPHVKFVTIEVLLDFTDLWRRSASNHPKTMTVEIV